ncbi:MAG: GAF domain-containing protein [Desulforhabdus sp.]|jgi:signal transduction protein with GAF and PtsI domain|nr:GAF domain-containing protein [Desulforhabdus sp.]
MQQPDRRIFLREFAAISHAISTYSDVNLLNSHLVEMISKSFKVKGSSIFLYDEREKQLFRVSSYGISESYQTKGPIYVDERFSEFKSGKPVFFSDFREDPRIQYPEEAIKEGIVSMLSVPIKFHEDVIGLIKIYNAEPWILHDEDLNSMCVIAEHLGLVLEYNGLKNFLDQVKIAIESLPLRMLRGISI